MDLVLVSLVAFFSIPVPIFLIWLLWGWPENWYWMTHVPAFRHNHIDASGVPQSIISKMSLIKDYSPGLQNSMITTPEGEKKLVQEFRAVRMFSHAKKMFIAGEDRHTTRYKHGWPQWYYNPDDMEPIPMRDWGNPRPLDPALVDAAFNNHSLEQMHRYGEKQSPLVMIMLVGFAVLGILMLVSLYYGHNITCQLDPTQCGTPVVHG